MLEDREREDAWAAARALLPAAKAYEARLRGLERTAGVPAAEAAYRSAIDAVEDICGRALAIPEGSLCALAFKAHVVKTWGRPEWWGAREGDADTAEQLAAQVLDAVTAMAEGEQAAIPS